MENEFISEYFREIGKKGGQAGTGDSKRRSPEAVAKAVKAMSKARSKKAKEERKKKIDDRPF
jgi:hypothetical protein